MNIRTIYASIIGGLTLAALALSAQAGVVVYGYDALGRLTKATYARGSKKSQTDVSYKYDARNNRTEENHGSSTGPGSGSANHAPVAEDDLVVLIPMSVDEGTGYWTVRACLYLTRNDTDADNDPLTITSPSLGGGGCDDFELAPSEIENYFDSYSYTVSDSQGGTDTATVTVVSWF